MAVFSRHLLCLSYLSRLVTIFAVTSIESLFLQPSYDTEIGGPRRKIPWIEYNDLVLSDSQLIVNYLNKEFNVDLNSKLSPKEKATAWAIQKWLEEFTYWYVKIKGNKPFQRNN